MIRVVNKKTHVPTENDFPIHRGYPLGNPFTHLPLDKTKALYQVNTINEAIFSFKQYLEEKLDKDDDPVIVDEMIRLYEHAKAGNDVNLVCFCKGTRENDICHGDIIKEILESKLFPKKLNIGIIGSRTATMECYPLLKELIDKEIGMNNINYIVSGGALGADSIGEQFAKDNNIKTKIFKPDWITHGKVAGFLRNTDIIENSDVVICLWDMSSKGTLDSINKAKERNKKVIIININE